MLVLSRKVGETLMIGDDIEVMITKVRGDRVTLGIAAPAEVKIRRGELPPRSVPQTTAAKSETPPAAD